MVLRKIVNQWLMENGYEGLCNDDCGCEIGDLMPCDTPNIHCSAGFKVPCPGPEKCLADGNCPWHISETKPPEGD